MNDDKFEVSICMGSSCFSRGNGQNLDIIRNFFVENNLDVDVSLSGELCTNLCSDGPILVINGRQYAKVQSDGLLEILKLNFKGES